MLQDLRFSLRLMAKERWFSAAAILALALGIGVNATGFTIVNAAFFRGLPFADSNRLYMLAWQNRSGHLTDVSHRELQDWRAQTDSFVGLAAFSAETMNVSDDVALPIHVRGAWITANAFSVLGQQPHLGRDFVTGDDRKGQGVSPSVIIGDRLWRSRYGADANVLGKSLRVNGQPATIIGVMPESMRFPDNTEIWAPLTPTDAQESRNDRPLGVFGRLKESADRRAAQAELNGIAGQLAAAYPDSYKDIVGIRAETFTENFVGGVVRTMFITIMAAVGFVLLIACANVANLLLSRSAFRAREIALRMALGATRWRVVRQLLLESVVLGFIGGGIGLLIALAGARMFDAAMQDSGAPYWITFTLDYVVFGYVAGICLLTAILFGLAPALHVSKTNANDVLKEGGRASAGSRRVRWFSSSLVVAELALTIVLLGGGGLMVRSFMKLYSVDLGISTNDLMTMRLQLPAEKYMSPEARHAFFERLEPRLNAIPGVQSFAVTTGVPPLDGGERLLEIDTPRRQSETPRFVSTVTISPRFFEVVGARLIRGRNFRAMDGVPGAETVIINERLAAQSFPGENPIGKRIRFTRRETDGPALPVSPAHPAYPAYPAQPWREIVGISPTIRQGSSQDAYLNAVVYLPYRQEAPATASLLIRSTLPPAPVMNAVRREVQAIDQDQPVFTIQTLEQVLAADRWLLRTIGSMFAIFGVIALVLSFLGLYAVMAYSVTQRTQEIGVRMAVGAQARQVAWLILKRGLLQLAIGLPLGLVGAVALGVVLQRMLVEITPADPVSLAAVAILLIVVSSLACLLPARRATRVDPLVALRTE